MRARSITPRAIIVEPAGAAAGRPVAEEGDRQEHQAIDVKVIGRVARTP
jgi:hypothetical protein